MKSFREAKPVKFITLLMAYLLLNSCMGTYYNVITPKQMQLKNQGQEWREGKEYQLIKNDSLQAAVAYNSIYKNYLVADVDFSNKSGSDVILDPSTFYLASGSSDSLGTQSMQYTYATLPADIALSGSPSEDVQIPTPPDKKSEEVMQTVCVIIGIVTVVAVVFYIIANSSDDKKKDKANNSSNSSSSSSSGSCLGSSNDHSSSGTTVVVVNDNEEELRQIRMNQEKMLAASEYSSHTQTLLKNALLKNTVKPGESISGKVYFRAPLSGGRGSQDIKFYLPLVSQQQGVEFNLLYDVKTEKR